MNPNIALWLSLGAAVLAVLYGVVTVSWVLKLSPGNARMQEIAGAIQEGAKAYMNRQYTTIAIAGVVLFVILGFALNWQTAIGFAVGAMFSGLAGYIGMFVSVRANVRTAEAATKGLNAGAHGRVPRRRGDGPARRRLGPARRRGLLRRCCTRLGYAQDRDLEGARRPRVRRLADLDLRASRRRHLHEGRRRRRGPRRQGRSRHSRGRPAQSGRDRGQRRRQRRRLRRHGRGPVRDLRGDLDRDDAARRPDGVLARRERGALPDRCSAPCRSSRRSSARSSSSTKTGKIMPALYKGVIVSGVLAAIAFYPITTTMMGANATNLYWRRADRPRADGRHGRDHRVLHGHELQPGAEGRGRVADGPRDQHHRGPRRFDEGDGAAR